MKTYKPTTKSRRSMTTLPYKELLSGDGAHKPLLAKKKRQGGRNGFGRITMRHQGGGHKRRLREIDFTDDTRIGVSDSGEIFFKIRNRLLIFPAIDMGKGSIKLHLTTGGLFGRVEQRKSFVQRPNFNKTSGVLDLLSIGRRLGGPIRWADDRI
jgi:hypothetical protein